jgi:hypothetical protein
MSAASSKEMIAEAGRVLRGVEPPQTGILLTLGSLAAVGSQFIYEGSARLR